MLKEEFIYFKKDPIKFCEYLGHDLSGALYDIEASNGYADKVCLRTIKRVVATLMSMSENANKKDFDTFITIHKLNVREKP